MWEMEKSKWLVENKIREKNMKLKKMSWEEKIKEKGT